MQAHPQRNMRYCESEQKRRSANTAKVTLTRPAQQTFSMVSFVLRFLDHTDSVHPTPPRPSSPDYGISSGAAGPPAPILPTALLMPFIADMTAKTSPRIRMGSIALPSGRLPKSGLPGVSKTTAVRSSLSIRVWISPPLCRARA